jgi:hypothetical protein
VKKIEPDVFAWVVERPADVALRRLHFVAAVREA